ncbi:hypothetical protein KPY62_03970 [Psychrobacter sp. TAE2020]|nr:hypothetical protein [Psychrobacter sp. TAE2020]MBU5616275.1 hypothetical protein [Psychrobacter sp. TAE2020]
MEATNVEALLQWGDNTNLGANNPHLVNVVDWLVLTSIDSCYRTIEKSVY